MRQTLRPQLLGHLRDMLAEKEEDLQELQSRLRASEELRGEAVARLESLENHFGVTVKGGRKAKPASVGARLDALEQHAAERNLDSYASGPRCSGEVDFEKRLEALEAAARNWQADGGDVVHQLRASHLLVEQLRQQLHDSDAGRAELVDESRRWQHEAEALRSEAAALRREAQSLRASSRTAAFQAEVQAEASSSSREVETLRGRLAESMREASLLRTKLASREADVARLELRVAELESAAISTGGDGRSHVALDQPASFGSAGTAIFTKARPDPERHRLDPSQALKSSFAWPDDSREDAIDDRPTTERSSRTVNRSSSNEPPQAPLLLRRDPQRMISAPSASSSTPSLWTGVAAASASDREAACVEVVSASTAPPSRGNLNRSSSPTRMSNMSGTTATQSPEWPALAVDSSSSLLTRPAPSTASSPDAPTSRRSVGASSQHGQQALEAAPIAPHRSQSVPVHLRHGAGGGASQLLGGPTGVSLARWAASPMEGHRSMRGESRRSTGSHWPLASGQPPQGLAQPALAQVLSAGGMGVTASALPLMGQAMRR